MNSNLVKVETVSFYNDTLVCPVINNEPYVIMNQVVENIGLNSKTAMHDLRRNERLAKHIALISFRSSSGQYDKSHQNRGAIRQVNLERNGEKENFLVNMDAITAPQIDKLGGYIYSILPVRKFTAWLYGLSPERVKPEIRSKLEKYQESCDDILFEFFFGTVARRKNTLLEKSQIRSRIQELTNDLDKDERYIELVGLKAEEMRLGKLLKELDTNEVNHQLTFFQSGLNEQD